ncbi:MAG: hypothetical protein CML04_12020 [Pseudozobellia sp.]|nr:hypothetical protein [Pseudozobellia sp.]MBG48473.1 hypothetical protein [Pseudozobellia sp.]|tara:strand:+ start:2221 stop:3045 length:825 start_codon:yes stop_codon:yes gene_type:complete
MDYFIRGNFCAALFRDILEPIMEAEVRIYHQLGPECDPPSNSATKELKLLSEKEVSAKKNCLIGTAKTDKFGNYSFNLPQTYRNTPIAIDILLKQAPRQKEGKHKPIQVFIRKLNPIWRSSDDCFIYRYNYSFPFEDWYQIRKLFDAWTIYGKITLEGSGTSQVSGLEVTAMDVDWIHDDFLGKALTNDKGYFRIDYGSADYKKTFLSPLINVETPVRTIRGPGVYFQVADSDGAVIYKEERKVGHYESRKNIPRCFFVDLHIAAENVPDKKRI